MSQPFSRFLHPFDIARHPSPEPEVKRAMLASWASDRNKVENRPSMREAPELPGPVTIDELLIASRSLDGSAGAPARR